MSTAKKWALRLLLGVVAALIVGLMALLIYQSLSDGPSGPLAGGPFKTGEEIEARIENWALLEGEFEFELVSQKSSRTAGGVLFGGDLYITCDLGFVWSRLPSGIERKTLYVIWLFKTWHKRAVADNRIRIRKNGRIYRANIDLVKDPMTIAGLKDELEKLASEYFQPAGLGPRPEQPPSDIWFFRVRQQ